MPDTPSDWSGKERRTMPSLVIGAADLIAAQDINRARTRRERILMLVGALIVACLVCVPVSIIIGHKLSESSRSNGQRNCQVQADARPFGNDRAFVSRQILRVADEAFQQFPARFQKAEVAKINRELNADRKHLSKKAPKYVVGFASLSVLLDDLPLIDCSTVIK